MSVQILDRLYQERDDELETIDRIAKAADEDGRELSTAEMDLISRSRERIDATIDPQIALQESVEESRTRHVRNGGSSPAAVVRRDVDPPAGETIYRTYGEYARDVIVSRFDQIASLAGGNVARTAAGERLSRVIANTLSGDVPGLIRPQYLDQIAQVIATSRPIVESARRVALTSGKLSYPSITQKPIVGKQTAEKTEAPSQKMTVAFVDVLAETFVGAGDLSWQAINWSTPDALGLWFDLAAEQYAIQTEAATGLVLAASTAQATPVVPATPTLADWMGAIVTAAGAIYVASRRRADTIYADVASGYSIMALVTNVAPVFFPAGDFSLSSGQGNIAGLRLVISSGLPAKTVVVAASQSLLVAETAGAPVELRAVEPAIGGMEVGIIGAFVSKITDTGATRKLTIT